MNNGQRQILSMKWQFYRVKLKERLILLNSYKKHPSAIGLAICFKTPQTPQKGPKIKKIWFYKFKPALMPGWDFARYRRKLYIDFLLEEGGLIKVIGGYWCRELGIMAQFFRKSQFTLHSWSDLI